MIGVKCVHSAWFLNKFGDYYYSCHLADEPQLGCHSLQSLSSFFPDTNFGVLVEHAASPQLIFHTLTYRRDVGYA